MSEDPSARTVSEISKVNQLFECRDLVLVWKSGREEDLDFGLGGADLAGRGSNSAGGIGLQVLVSRDLVLARHRRDSGVAN